jgi:hypothetical protein
MGRRFMYGPNSISVLKIRFLIILFLLGNGIAKGQFSMNEFLSDARNDVRLYENKIKSEFLEEKRYRSPIIHRVEFRARTNDFNITQDDYRLRFSPTNPWEISANKKYYAIEKNSLIIDYQYALNKAIYKRYNQIISFFQISDEIQYKEKEIILQQDQLKVLEATLGNSDFDIAEYIKEKENLLNLSLDLNDLLHTKEKVELEIKSSFRFSGNIEYDVTSQFISYEQIKSIVEIKSVISDTVNNIHIENLNRQITLDEQRIVIEKAEGRRNIGYIQAEYDRFRGDDFDNHFGVQVGVRIPLTNADKPDLNRRKLNVMEDKADVVREKTALEIQCDLLKLDLEFLFSQYELISGEISNDNLLILLNLNQNIKAEDLLEAQISILKMKKYEKLIQWDVYKSFIDYLYYSGKLIDIPLKNYLSESLEEI